MQEDIAFHGKSEIHRRILDGFFDEGLSLSTLEAQFGRSKVAINRLVKAAKDAGRARLREPASRRSVLSTPALTHLHKRIGMRVIRWRTLENNYGVPEGAEKLGITLNRLHSIEGGIYNWTLLELTFFCERLGWNLVDLLRGADLRDYLVPDNAA